MTAYIHDAVTDYSAPTDGSNLAPACASWNDFIVNTMTPSDTLEITLRNAAGGGSDEYNAFLTTTANFCKGALGGRTVKFIFQDGIQFGGSFSLTHNQALFDDNQHSVRLEPVAPGDTTVTLKTPAEHTRIPEGRWVAVGDTDIQGFGSPFNNRRYHHALAESKVAETGVFTLDRPSPNEYLDTLPVFNAGSSASVPNAHDCGGPATMWVFVEEYDLDITFTLGENVRIARDALDLIYCKARKVTVNAPASSGFGGLGLSPTVCAEMYLNGGYNGDNQTEIDKVIGELHNNGTRWKRVHNQSGIGRSFWTNTVCERDFELMRKVELNGGNDLQGKIWAGPLAYGRTDSLIIRGMNSIAGPWQITDRKSQISDWAWQGGGIFRATRTNRAGDSMLHPGTSFYFSGNRNFGKPFMVTAATFDDDYLYSHTTLTTYPTFDTGSTGFVASLLRPQGIDRIYNFGTVLSSNASIRALNRYPKGRPHGEYTEIDIAGAHGANTDNNAVVNGEFEWMEIDVQRAYTGEQATMRLLLGNAFGFFVMNDQTIARPQGLYVDTKVAGVRRITPGDITGDAVSDNLNTFQGWFMDTTGGHFPTSSLADTDDQQAIVQIRIRSNMGPPVRAYAWDSVAA